MKVKVDGFGEVSLSDGANISSLIEKLDHHQDSVIVLEDREPTPLDKELDERKEYKIISVVSGG